MHTLTCFFCVYIRVRKDTKYLSSLLDGRFKIEADEKMIEALILFANKCATSQHFVIRAHACRLVIRALPALLLLLRQAETAVTLDVLVPLLDAFPRTELAAERATLQRLVASNADTLLASITTELDAIASRNYNNSSNGNDGLNEHDWRRCDSLLFVFTLLPQTPQAEEELVSCVSKLAAAAVAAGKGRSAMNTLAVITGAADRSLHDNRALQDESTVDALVEHTLQELNCGAYCSVRCCAAWIRGFCTNALNSDRTYKLQPVLRKAAEVVKSSASVPAGDRHRSLAAAYSALLVIHALETTAKQQLKELQHLIDSKDIITLAPTMEVPLPKEEAELLLGATAPAPWSERLGEMSLCAWETLRELPFPRGDSAAWGRVLDAIAYPPSSAGLTALLEAVTAWVAADKGFVTPKELRKASRRGFRAVTGEFPSDRALLDAWTRLAFHPALVQDAEFVGFTKKLMQKVFAYGQKNALAVNRMAAQFILGFSWEDEEKKKKEGGGNHYTLLEHEYFDELCEMLVFGPNRDQFDGTYFMSLAYDDELLDESAYALPLSSEAETKAAAAGRAKDLRDYYTRVLANALVLAAPAESRLPGLVLERVNEALTEDLRAHITLYSDRSRRQLRHLQTLCLLAPRAGQAEGDKLAACLAQMLAHDAYAPVRAFSLLALTRLALADPRRAEPLRRAIENPGQKNFFLHAALTVWGTVLANAPLERAPALVDDLVPRIIPHISGPVAIKTTAQCALTVLLEQGRIAHKPALEAVVRSITQFLGGGGTAAATPSSSNSSNGDTDHMSQLLVAWLAMGSLLRCSISDVFHRLPLSVEGYPGPDIATNAFCEEVAQTAFSFTASCTDGVVFAEGGVPVPIVPSEHRAALVSRYCSRRTPLPYEIWGGEKAAGTGQVQRKPLPWIVGDEEEITRLTRRTRQNLILVASLVDKPPNLGGMCRTADIFNIREYVIPDAKLKNHPQFQAVAVTSDHWVPISVVNEEGLPAYLAQKRKEGYKLFGVEQTNESISLNDLVFPDRSLLLLGKEQQGIPANLIALLDACIEVPQLGFIRSLNVHVTAALVTWEYSKQHAFAEKKIAAKK